ncbi:MULTISPECIES: class I adenylate-forming enzyme family protein [unclassified Bacillus (in: firmicutes)]|uniref:class I adenylate-forming enzyme family protein n=1 Tax=unclassified Bacillus (in: firmicutes) TaxID=185979 RepID=UPI0008F1195D|nr:MULTISPECIES: long-chain-fatty-acid--CoA ligase [unclassified Bacillus (in: firmicutes)]SFB09837.1 feruloyl-CoA synthase [Bacillus sp. UNCCL13]SFQ86525.1 feruloyl-CoA synthase [Bacillus sp. cl95]
MNVSELLSRNARKYPFQEAVVTESDRVTYKELNEFVNRFAQSLKDQGVSPSDKVVLFLPNTLEFVISYFAIQRLGAIVVPVNAKLSQGELAYIVEHCDAKAMITHDLLFETAKLLPNLPTICIKTGEDSGVWRSFSKLLESGADGEILCQLKEDDESTVLYTSGTTGKPKGVLFTYRNILTVATMMSVEMEMKPESRILHMMPLSHSAPLHLFLVAGTFVGATHVLSETFTPERLLQLVHTEKTTHFFGAPVAYLFTAKQPNLPSYDLSSMKYWVYGGAPLSKGEVEFVENSFQTKSLYCVYGLTESGPSGTLLMPEEHGEKAGSIGRRGALGTELRIVDSEGNDVKTGEIGEILLFGEGIMKGYYKNPEETKAVFLGEWVRTGDLGKRDAEGFLWIVDRKKDLIISGGVNIYPKEIEEELIKHSLISEVAVIGVPHPEWGETVKAFVVCRDELQDIGKECHAFLAGKIASYKIPRLYEQVAVLPRNATGKILKQVLRKTHQEV